MDWAIIIITIIFSLLGGILGGALYTLIKLIINERKSKKQWQNKQGVMTYGGIVGNEISLQEPIKQNEITKEKQIIPNYKNDFKLFTKANKILESEKKKYEKGKISYQELKDKFEYFKNKDYYKRIVEKKQ